MSKIKTYFMELGDVYVRTDTGELCGPYEGIEEAILDIEFGWDEIVAAVKAAAALTEPGQVAFDGSVLSPSDRTIPGVEAIWEADEEGPWSQYDIWQEADDRLTKLYDELGLYWEEGVLYKGDDHEADDAVKDIRWVIDDLRSWESNSESARYNADMLERAMSVLLERLGSASVPGPEPVCSECDGKGGNWEDGQCARCGGRGTTVRYLILSERAPVGVELYGPYDDGERLEAAADRLRELKPEGFLLDLASRQLGSAS